MDAPGWTKIETPLGDAFVRGTEVHLDPNVTRRPTRAEFRDFFGPLLDKFGFLTTRVPHGMDDEFTRRLGFKETWKDDQNTYYMLDHIPFTKRRKDS